MEPQQGFAPPPYQPAPQPANGLFYAPQQPNGVPPMGGPPPPGQQATVVVVRQGNCPQCRVGQIIPQYTVCGMILAVLFFPIGILCCLCMKEMRCTNCGASF